MVTIRLKKEVRALFWPWFAMISMAALPLVLRPLPSGLFASLRVTAFDLSGVSFWLGIPLLAAFSLENEFQSRTLILWLAQPDSRMQLWREKLIVSGIAVLSVASISSLSVISLTRENHQMFVLVALTYVIVTMASATFWILAARSSTVGFILCLAVNSVIFNVLLRSVERGLLRSALKTSPVATAAAMLASAGCYAGLTLWLGARELTHWQVRGAHSDDLVTGGPALMPEFVARWFRCRPNRPLLNLILKELHLLRPLWLTTLSGGAIMALLVIFGLMPDFSRPAHIDLPRAIAGTLMISLLSTAILGGSLSMGEERKSGTHAWHMTLPVSFRSQWLIKLVTSILAGLFGPVLVPVVVLVAGGALRGSALMYMNTVFCGCGDSLFTLPEWLLLSLVLSVASFWCACAVNGTVRAATWVCPVLTVVFFAGAAGKWLAIQLAHVPAPVRPLEAELVLLFLPAVLFGVFQSYRLFRIQPQEKISWIVRCVTPLGLASLLCSFVLSL